MAAYKAVSVVVLVCALFASEVLSVPGGPSRPGGHKGSHRPPVAKAPYKPGVGGSRPDGPFDYSSKSFNYSLQLGYVHA